MVKTSSDLVLLGLPQFFFLESLVRHKTALRDIWESPEWLNSRSGRSKDETAKEVQQLVLSSTKQALLFWKHADEVIKLVEPLIRVLRLVYEHDKPTMGFITRQWNEPS